jgi:multisubunit Na+/H+ antiporter MnhB subunit
MDSYLTTRLNFTHVSLAQGVLICLFLGSFYVVSLYLWSKQNRFSRNDPSVIRRRFLSVLISCLVSLLLVHAVAQKPAKTAYSDHENSFTIREWLGFNLGTTTLSASLTSLLLTMTLFAGPLAQWLASDYLYSQPFRVYDPMRRDG